MRANYYFLSSVHSTKYHVGTKLRNRVYNFSTIYMHGYAWQNVQTTWLSVSLVYKLRSIPSTSTNRRWFCLLDQSDTNIQKKSIHSFKGSDMNKTMGNIFKTHMF